MNIKNLISNHCLNKNQRKIFFLSYSCYIPYIESKIKEKKVERNTFISYIMDWDIIILFIAYLFMYIDKYIFFKSLKHSDVNIKNMTLMIDNIDIDKEKILIAINEIFKEIKKIINEDEEIFKSININEIIKEINYSILNTDEKELYENFNK